MANSENYYRHLRYRTGLTTVGNKKIAIVRYTVPKQGCISGWLFSKATDTTVGDVTTTTTIGVPTGFNAYLFSSVAALIDYSVKSGYGTPQLPELDGSAPNGIANFQYANAYSGNPADYIVLGGASEDTVDGTAITAPMPNFIRLPWEYHDWVPYSCDDYFLAAAPDVLLYGIIEFPSTETLTKLHTRLIVN